MPPPSPPPDQLPLKPIPGGYGLPILGPISDRLNLFYYQGRDAFFANLIKKHNSTMVRTNMPPGPFIARDPKVVALLDSASFPVLFDTSKVEKRNVLDGTFFPSVSFTGGHRMLAYLDPSEPKHGALKSLLISDLSSKNEAFVPLFRDSISKMYAAVDHEFAAGGHKVDFNALSDGMAFDFMFRLFCNNKDPGETEIGSRGPAIVDKWLALQLAPLASPRLLPKLLSFIEDFFLRTLPLPSTLVQSDYDDLYAAFYNHAAPFLNQAAELGIRRDEACHNLVFVAAFNAYGAMKSLFPSLIKWVAGGGAELQRDLALEIRTIVREEGGGGICFGTLDRMTLTKSVIYEVLRMDPPVPYQYGKLKEDTVVHSHDAAFLVKKGEMLFGYQPFASRDPKVFDRAEEFIGDRFVGSEGEELLKYVYWSNGRETQDPTVWNKQCPGKDLVVHISRLFLVDFFLRYDGLTVATGPLPFLGSAVTVTSLTKATSAV